MTLEDVLNYAEFGVLGAITFLLLTRGLSSLNELAKTTAMLSDSQKALADSISRLTEKINGFSFQLADIEKRLDKLEENSNRNFIEIRNLLSAKNGGLS